MELPVFIINGFLESGKTAFIKDTLKGEDFNDGTRSLIIACEDGEEEYSEIEMQKVNAKVVFVEDMDEFTKDFFIAKCNESKAERVFVEYPDNLSCTFRKYQHGYFHIFLLLL